MRSLRGRPATKARKRLRLGSSSSSSVIWVPSGKVRVTLRDARLDGPGTSALAL